jgi:hypothetical protein
MHKDIANDVIHKLNSYVLNEVNHYCLVVSSFDLSKEIFSPSLVDHVLCCIIVTNQPISGQRAAVEEWILSFMVAYLLFTGPLHIVA